MSGRAPGSTGGNERRDGCADEHFDAYVRDHRTVLVRYATLLSGSAALAEDLVQDVLVRLYPRWASIDDGGDAHPYVRRCVTNEFLSWRRRWSTRNVRVAADSVLESASDASREGVPGSDVTGGPDSLLWQRLQSLPGQQRAAVVLRFWEDLTDVEIGDVLGCRPGTVRAHVSRGVAALRASIGSGERL